MAPSITLIVFTDGRKECLTSTMASLNSRVDYDLFENRFIFDDSHNLAYADWLDAAFPQFEVIHHAQRLGFCIAVHNAWELIERETDSDFIFHIEDDFTYNETPDFEKMSAVLTRNPELAQLALLRQPVSPEEWRLGGIFPKHGMDNFHEQFDPEIDTWWVEHDIFWTTNPSLFRRDILAQEWPIDPLCEGFFSIRLREKGFRFGFWGKKSDPPKIHHIGDVRVGTGY